ncbi:hypothetical protein, partial [Bradyrhizobium sp.]|uniref:hypothetical protein n=1 Tax=Bradyrhizobium sp. TaxID=376 RepID=UPI003C430147
MPVVEACAAATFWLASAVAPVAVAVASVDVELDEEPPVAVVAASVFPCVVFGVMGTVAATAVVTAEASAGVGALACALEFKAIAGAAAFPVVAALPDVVG